MDDDPGRDVALVLSGGGINGVLLELGFLQRLRESSLWPRIGWVYGTSAGALAGVMGALDRLDELEAFLLSLQPDEAFRPHRLWQLPFAGLHDYVLPETIAERIGPPAGLVGALQDAPVELVVCVTDIAGTGPEEADHAYERVYSSRTSSPEEMGMAILASAAINALVLPLRLGDVVGTDGGWVRNFPLGHAYDNPDAKAILGFRYVTPPRRPSTENLARLRRRLERFRAVPPVRAIIGEIDEAEQRQARGEPPHLADMIVRLMHVAVARNTALEERSAAEKDRSVHELEALRGDVAEIARRHALPGRGAAAAHAVHERFDAALFPFRGNRALPTLIVRGGPGEHSLDPTFRPGLRWEDEPKRALIQRGWALADVALHEREIE